MKYEVRLYKDNIYQIISVVQEDILYINVADEKVKVDNSPNNVGQEQIEFQGSIVECDAWMRLMVKS